jgi:hypothetical protein
MFVVMMMLTAVMDGVGGGGEVMLKVNMVLST